MEKKTIAIRYDAFISYSHEQDKALAPLLHDGLRSLAKPWHKLEALSIFRDQTNLSAAPELWPTIEQALAESEYFILLASPKAATSKWVKDEIDYWLRNKGKSNLLIALTSGRIVWRDGNFDWRQTNALPNNLDAVFAHEPNFADFSTFKLEDCSLGNDAFQQQLAKLAAPLHKTHVGNLIGQQERHHRRMLTIRNSVIIILLSLLTVLLYSFLKIRSESKANSLAVQGIELEDLDPTQAYRTVLAAHAESGDPSLFGIARNIFKRNLTYSKSYRLPSIICADYSGDLFLAVLDSVTVQRGTARDTATINLSEVVSGALDIQINSQHSHFLVRTSTTVYVFDLAGKCMLKRRGLYCNFQRTTGRLHVFDSALTRSVFDPGNGYCCGLSVSPLPGAYVCSLRTAAPFMMSADGSTLLVADGDQCIILDSDSLKRKRPDIPFGTTSQFAVSPTGKYIAVSNTFNIQVYNSDSVANTFRSHLNYPVSLKFSPVEEVLISTGMDYRGFVHNLSDNSSYELLAHFQSPYVRIAHDGRSFITYDRKKAFRWQITNAPVRILVENNPSAVSAVKISPRNTYIAGGDMDGRVWVWDREGRLIMHATDMANGGTKERRFAFSNDEQAFYYLGTNQQQIIRFEFATKLLRSWHNAPYAIKCIATNHKNELVGLAESGHFLVWSPGGALSIGEKTIKRPEHLITVVSRGIYLITADAMGFATIYDDRGNMLHEFPYDDEGTIIQSVDLSKDAKYLMMGSNDGAAKVITDPLRSGPTRESSASRLGYVMGIRFLNQTSGVLTVGDDQKFRVLDGDFQSIASGKTGTEFMVWDVDVSPDDKEFVTGDDHSVKLWQLNLDLEPE